MEKMVAYCGLVCSDCEAYIATQADDREALEGIAARWRKEYNAPDITVDAVVCDGCQSESERKCGHCAQCEIRACGVERGLANCAHCADYACDKIEGFFGMAPDARGVLDGIRASL